MRLSEIGRFWLAGVAACCASVLCASALCAQAQRVPATSEVRLPIQAQVAALASHADLVFPADPVSHADANIVREIDDPHTGSRWLLERDESRPGGPGRLVLAGGSARSREQSRAQSAEPGRVSAAAVPVIRAGDRLIVEENTPLVEARFEAIALSPASAGAPLRVRLAIGGHVVRGIAVAAGRAKLAPEGEVRP